MINLKNLCSLFLLSFSLNTVAQDTAAFVSLNKSDFQISSEFTEDADVVILLDSGHSYYNEKLQLIFRHSTRVKILNEAGKSWANIKVPYSINDSLRNINGISYRLNREDSVVTSSLPPEDIKSDTIADDIVQTYISIPDVEVGSIIEYTYELRINDWKDLNTWYFQHDVPVLKSTYTTSIPASLLFYKNLEGVRGLSNLKRSPETAVILGDKQLMMHETYIMDSIPSFKDEKHIPGEDYFISKIRFHLAEYTLPGEETKYLLPESYEELAFNWAADPYFRQVYSRGSFLNEKIDQIYFREFAPLKNIQSFFYYVRNNFTVDNAVQTTSLEDVFTNKRGSAQQINMLLTKILNQAGYNAYLIALCTIDNRPTYPEYPNFELFNHFVSMVRVNGQNYFMDASDNYLLFNMLAPNSVNSGGLVISRTAPGFAPLDFNFEDKEQTVANFVISDTATVSGTIEVKREGYAVYNFDIRFLGNNRTYNDYLIETIFENLNWDIKKHEVYDEFEANKVIKEVLEFSRPADSTAKNYMRIKPVVFNEYQENPFSSKERQNPITLYTPITRKASYIYELPAGWQLEKLPPARSFALEGNKAQFMYNSTINGNKLTIEYALDVNQVIYMSEEYPELRGFFEMMVQLLQQEIILIR